MRFDVQPGATSAVHTTSQQLRHRTTAADLSLRQSASAGPPEVVQHFPRKLCCFISSRHSSGRLSTPQGSPRAHPVRQLSWAGMGRTGSRSSSGGIAGGEPISPTILNLTESWLQTPSRRATADGGDAAAMPQDAASRQRQAQVAAVMVDHLLQSPDKVPTRTANPTLRHHGTASWLAVRPSDATRQPRCGGVQDIKLSMPQIRLVLAQLHKLEYARNISIYFVDRQHARTRYLV